MLVVVLAGTAGLLFYLLRSAPQQEWILPKHLNEISGICWVNDHTLACVQDEDGSIFLYDLDKNEIVNEIPFAGKGDYEGIAIKDQTAYVVSGDGELFVVEDFMRTPRTKKISLNLLGGQESEAICFDPIRKSLLLAFKDHDKTTRFPAFYTISFRNDSLVDSLLMPADFHTEALRKKEQSHYKRYWEPADIAVDPTDGSIYVVDAINLHLMVFDQQGTLKKIHEIDPKKIRHPEGVTLAPDGKIYICNDANNEGKGKIVLWGKRN